MSQRALPFVSWVRISSEVYPLQPFYCASPADVFNGYTCVTTHCSDPHCVTPSWFCRLKLSFPVRFVPIVCPFLRTAQPRPLLQSPPPPPPPVGVLAREEPETPSRLSPEKLFPFPPTRGEAVGARLHLPLAWSLGTGLGIAALSPVCGRVGSSGLFFKLPHRRCGDTAGTGRCHRGPPRRSGIARPRSSGAGASERISVSVLRQRPGNLPLDCFTASAETRRQPPGPHSGISYAVVHGRLYESICSGSSGNPTGARLCWMKPSRLQPGPSEALALEMQFLPLRPLRLQRCFGNIHRFERVSSLLSS